MTSLMYVGLGIILIGRLIPSRRILHLLFAIGAICFVIYAISIEDIPFIVVNSILGVIDLIQFIRYKNI